jgi:cell division protein FtsL
MVLSGLIALSTALPHHWTRNLSADNQDAILKRRGKADGQHP